jgi:hypothetical protein
MEMEAETPKSLPRLAIAEIPFNIKQNGCTKEFRIVLRSGRQSRKIMDARSRPNNGNDTFLA